MDRGLFLRSRCVEAVVGENGCRRAEVCGAD